MTNSYLYDDELLLMNKTNGTGKCNIYYNKGKFSLSGGVVMFKPKNNNMIIQYLHYFLLMNKNTISSFFVGSDKKNLNINGFKTIKLHNIQLDQQKEIIIFLDEYFNKYDINEFNEYLGNFNIFQLLIEKNHGLFDNLQPYIQMIKESEKLIEEQHDWKHETKKKYLKIIKKGYDIINVYKNNQSMEEMNLVFDTMIKTMVTLENIPKMKRLQIQSIFNSLTLGVEKKKLDEICKLIRGKILKISNIVTGKYPVIGGGQNPMGYHNEYNRNENTILISQSGSYAGYLSKNTEKVWASDCFSIETANKILDNKYLWYYLKSNQEKIYKLQHGNGQPHINTNDLNKFKIPVPSLEIQEKIVQKIDELNLDTSHYNQYQKILQTELDNIIEIINNMSLLCDTEYEQNLDEEIVESDDEAIVESVDESVEYEKIII